MNEILAVTPASPDSEPTVSRQDALLMLNGDKSLMILQAKNARFLARFEGQDGPMAAFEILARIEDPASIADLRASLYPPLHCNVTFP